jgi:hypothetical protein
MIGEILEMNDEEEWIRKEMDKVMNNFVKEYFNIHFFNGITDEEINEFVKMVKELQNEKE